MRLSLQELAALYQLACIAEIEAVKPGNVHIFADGHGMTVADFLTSAEVSATVIAAPGISVGKRILHAVQSTYRAVGFNTNLGIILLCAPLLHLCYLSGYKGLLNRLDATLNALSVADCQDTYQAIMLASPSGLGNRGKYDIQSPVVEFTLLEAMQQAQHEDSIARQYCTSYTDVWRGLSVYREAMQRWQNPAWATTALYLMFLSQIPDTHIVRQYGHAVAQQVCQAARLRYLDLMTLENPKRYLADLLKFDTELKLKDINPGTSADMTVATLLLDKLQAVSDQ